MSTRTLLVCIEDGQVLFSGRSLLSNPGERDAFEWTPGESGVFPTNAYREREADDDVATETSETSLRVAAASSRFGKTVKLQLVKKSSA
jgi:hypothetical protein